MSLKNKQIKSEHDHNHLDKLVSQNVTIVFALNLFFAILEFIFGVLFNSTATSQKPCTKTIGDNCKNSQTKHTCCFYRLRVEKSRNGFEKHNETPRN